MRGVSNRARRIAASWLLVGCLGLAACGSGAGLGAGSGPKAGVHDGSDPRAATTAAPTIVEVTGARADYYRGIVPVAQRFVEKKIPASMLSTADAGNESYVIAYAADGQIAAYMRDFVGPVSPKHECSCDPLKITLVFDPALAFTRVVDVDPLHKLGHVPLTPEEHARMEELARDPPEALMQAASTDDLVDAVTGATKTAYAEVVVTQAALTTHRLAALVRDTQKLLVEAPKQTEKTALDELLAANGAWKDAELALRLAAFVPSLVSPAVQQTAFRRMVRALASQAEHEGQASAAVTTRLLDPTLAGVVPADRMVGCYALATHGIALDVVDRCVTMLEHDDQELGPGELHRLRGTLWFRRSQFTEAFDPLARAVGEISILEDPALHGRFIETLQQIDRKDDACTRARRLYAEQPLLPRAREYLGNCASGAQATASELDQRMKESLLASRRDDALRAPILEVDDAELRPTKLALAAPGKITVLAIFSTWCPHCQVELPKVLAFAHAVGADAARKDRVRVIGLRTAIEREKEPYDVFAQRYGLDFAVYTDPAMAIAFSQFAKAFGLAASLPTLAVLDEHGALRYVLETGAYKDTARDLTWAVDSLLAR